jgi:proliferating cell nuclear antigen
MKLTLDSVKADTFTAIFQHIKNFTDQINIHFSSEKMYVQTMDSARVSIVEIEIPSQWFVGGLGSYDCPISIALGINVNIFWKILNSKDKLQVLEIESTGDSLCIHFLNPEVADLTTTTFEKHFEVPLIDIDIEMMQIPTIDYQAEFTISSTKFAEMIQQLRMFGDTMEITCSEEKISLYSNSQDSGKMSVEINIDDLTSFAINEGDELKLSFSLMYLNYICMYNKIAKDVDIRLCTQYPLSILYDLGQEAKMLFYLAPKMEDS